MTGEEPSYIRQSYRNEAIRNKAAINVKTELIPFLEEINILLLLGREKNLLYNFCKKI